MRAGGGAARDYLGAVWHGFGQTHLDALCHAATPDGTLYNGHPVSSVGPGGCARLGFGVAARTGVVGRGVLVDVPRHLGRALRPGDAIRAADLDAALAAQRTALRPWARAVRVADALEGTTSAPVNLLALL